jgi:hypothetical protein
MRDMEEMPRCLSEGEAWDRGLTQKALALCGDGDILVGVILDGKGRPFAVVYTEREGVEPHAWLLPLEGEKWKKGGED